MTVRMGSMGMKMAAFVVCLVVSGAAFADGPVPKDVKAFIDDADACEHFAGEFDSGQSKQRRKEIERGVIRYCQPAKNQLRRLTVKYKDDARVMEIIRGHANDSLISFR